MVSFEEIPASDLDDQCIEWLEQAASGFGGMVSVQNCVDQSHNGIGKFILAKKAIKLRGVFYLTFTQQEFGRVMTLLLLGGEDIAEWRDELAEFLYEFAHLHHVDQFFYMGRKGFSRLWPELEECARVYRVILKPSKETIN